MFCFNQENSLQFTRLTQQLVLQVGEYWVSAHSEAEAKEKAARKLGVDVSDIVAEQDPDVLDTWFSSALFPFSVFGWPDEVRALQSFT